MTLSADERISALDSLSSMGRRTLRAIVISFGAQPFTDERLLARTEPGFSGAEYRIGLLELLGKRLIHSVRKGWGEKCYFIPRDSYYHYHAWFPDLAEPAAVPDWEIQLPFTDSQNVQPYGLRLMYGLAELVRCGLKLTNKGVFPKRTIEKCLLQIRIPEQLTDCLKLNAESAADRLSFDLMMDFIVRMGFITRQGLAYRLEEERLLSFLSLSAQDREAFVIRFWMNQYALRSPSLSNAAASIGRLAADQWYCLSQSEEEAQQAWCSLMAGLGWMEQSQTNQGAAAYRWLYAPMLSFGSDPAAEASFGMHILLSPDGDIYVPQEAMGVCRWGLEFIARRISSDVMTIYRLDRESVERAADFGLNFEAVVAFLEWASNDTMPESLLAAVDGWMRERMVHLEPVVQLPGIHDRSGQTGSISPTSPQHMGLPTQSLGQEGYPIGEPVDLGQYAVLTEHPEPSSIYQGLNEIPAVWRSHMRAYHPSTRRELLERALSWRVPVKLMIRGEVVPFIPEQLEGDGALWSVKGQLRMAHEVEPVSLVPSMWEEMMLIIPMPAKD